MVKFRLSLTTYANQMIFMENAIKYLLRNSLYYMLVFLIALGLKYHLFLFFKSVLYDNKTGGLPIRRWAWIQKTSDRAA